MRVVTIALGALIVGFSVSVKLSAQSHEFWTSHSRGLVGAQDPADCDNVVYGNLIDLYPHLGAEFDYTFVNTGTTIDLYSIGDYDLVDIDWEIERLTGPSLPDITFDSGQSIQYTFNKVSSDYSRLYEWYRVRFMVPDSAVVDSLDVHVFPTQKGGNESYTFSFDTPRQQGNPAYVDGFGHYKATTYSKFSGNGNTRSDTGSNKEGVDDKCAYTAYFSNESIDGSEAAPRLGAGCINSWCPSTADIEQADLTLNYSACAGATSSNYGYCDDPCDLNPYRIPYEDFVRPDCSRSAKSELNVYANQLQGEKAYYGFSFKIPTDFDETDLVAVNGDLGSDRWHIIGSFHQSVWPFKRMVIPATCNSTMQLLYLGNNQIAIQYGLLDFNRVAFGPYDITKGEWTDVIIGVTWQQYGNAGHLPSDPGSFEFWLNTSDEYQKQCLIPATSYYMEHEDFDDKPQNIQPFIPQDNYTTVEGPNVENVNPPYFALNQMRGNKANGTSGFNFDSHVFYDEFRISTDINDVVLPGLTIAADPTDCYQTYLGSRSSFGTRDMEAQQVAENGMSLGLFPNPSEGESTNVIVRSPGDSIAGFVRVINAIGQSVFEIQVESGEVQERVLEVPVESLNRGVYTVTWTYLNESVSLPMMIR